MKLSTDNPELLRLVRVVEAHYSDSNNVNVHAVRYAARCFAHYSQLFNLIDAEVEFAVEVICNDLFLPYRQ